MGDHDDTDARSMHLEPVFTSPKPDASGGCDREEAEDRIDPEAPTVPEPIPEADSAETAEAWEETGGMGGEAPTG